MIRSFIEEMPIYSNAWVNPFSSIRRLTEKAFKPKYISNTARQRMQTTSIFGVSSAGARGNEPYPYLHLCRHVSRSMAHIEFHITRNISRPEVLSAHLDFAFRCRELCFEIWCGEPLRHHKEGQKTNLSPTHFSPNVVTGIRICRSCPSWFQITQKPVPPRRQGAHTSCRECTPGSEAKNARLYCRTAPRGTSTLPSTLLGSPMRMGVLSKKL